jgi:hypothetical protein
MATPIKSLFPPSEKKPFLLNKQKKAGVVARRRVSTLSLMCVMFVTQNIKKTIERKVAIHCYCKEKEIESEN